MSAVIEAKGGFRTWLNKRLPVDDFVATQLTGYYAPKNFNIWYFFGSLALLMFVMQIVTGIFVTMHFKPGDTTAWDSVQKMVREVPYMWLIQPMHAVGASFFFIVVYLHMARAFLYGSYKAPRELLWVIGMLIYLALMAEAFMGYVLPFGNMSYWGAQVIINIFGTIPGIGPDLVEWIRGDYGIGDATLNRFFSLHVVALPFIIALLIALHLVALRQVGSNNPDGIEIKEKLGPDGKPLDGIPFHPYYTVKDLAGAVVFLAIFCVVMFFVPEMGGYFLEHNNFIPADPLKTPEHIAPVWYFTPYYSILRAVPPLFNSQFPGVAAMGIATLILFFLPWLDRSPVKSIRYRGALYKGWLAAFVVVFVLLGYLGVKPTTVWGQFGFDAFFLDTKDVATWVARLCTVVYFLFFILMPWYTLRDKVKPVPERVSV